MGRNQPDYERGNYGWNLREAKHEFAPNSTSAGPGLIDPIYEYHHDIGKSITGGHVYRGKKVPELAGHYLYADYVTGRIWALKYDEAKKAVVANRAIQYQGAALPVISFGEDEAERPTSTSSARQDVASTRSSLRNDTASSEKWRTESSALVSGGAAL